MIFNNHNNEPVRLDKKLTMKEKWALKKEKVGLWTMKHRFTLIALTALFSMLTFILLSIMLVGSCTESGMYYNQLLNGNL